MVKSMYAAVAGLRTHQAKMDVIGNNIANVNTYGYKKARATFRDQFYATLKGSSEANDVYGGGNPSQVGYGVALSSVDIDFGTGAGAPTGNGMDVMINGNGFFMVGAFAKSGYATISNNTDMLNITSLYYTRVGIFNIDGQGNFVDSCRNYVYGFLQDSPIVAAASADDPEIVEVLQVPWCYYTADGKPVTGADGKAVRVEWKADPGPPPNYELDADGFKVRDDGADPAGWDDTAGDYIATMKLTNISIGADGVITGTNRDTEENITIGQIAVADVPNANALENISEGYYKAKKNTGVITAELPGKGSTGSLEPGKLEMSNVDLAQEFTDMITTQRGFQANGRIITVTDEMLAELVNLKR